MAKKNDPDTLTFSITLDFEELAKLGAAERKNVIEQQFTAAKEQAVDAVTARMAQ